MVLEVSAIFNGPHPHSPRFTKQSSAMTSKEGTAPVNFGRAFSAVRRMTPMGSAGLPSRLTYFSSLTRPALRSASPSSKKTEWVENKSEEHTSELQSLRHLGC